MIFHRKEPSGTIFILGDVWEYGTKCTIHYGKKSASPPVMSQRPAREALTRKASNRLGRQVREASTQGKKINGIKRHIMVDTLGLLLVIVVHAANIQDRDGAKLVLEKAKNRFPRLQLLWADGG